MADDPMALDPLSPPPHFPGLAADPSIKELRAEVERLRLRDEALCDLNARLTRSYNAQLIADLRMRRELEALTAEAAAVAGRLVAADPADTRLRDAVRRAREALA